MSAREEDLTSSPRKASADNVVLSVTPHPQAPHTPPTPHAALSVEGRLLRRLLRFLGDPAFAFVLWTGERVAPFSEGLVGEIRIADRGTLLGLLRDPQVQ